MRTTLTLDDDVASRLKQLAHRKRISFKEAVNAAIRRGLAAQQLPHGGRKRFAIRTFSSGFVPGVDPVGLNQLADELETRRFVEKTSQ
jgi:hypothetical protein